LHRGRGPSFIYFAISLRVNNIALVWYGLAASGILWEDKMVVEVVVWGEEAPFRSAFEWQVSMKSLKASR
jgi:hypothetical protein